MKLHHLKVQLFRTRPLSFTGTHFIIFMGNLKLKMKRSFLLVLVSILSVHSFAQKILNEGILTYNISIENTKGGSPVAGSLNGAVLTVYLTANKSRTEMQSTPGIETAAFDAASGKGFILKEYSAQKLMITLTEDNWKQKNRLNSGLEFKAEEGTTVINNYTCKKAVATAIDGKKYIVYYDPSVQLTNKTYNNAFPQVNGLPVRYELQSGDLTFKYDLVKYSSETIAPAKFDVPKTGFRVMSFEENQQLKKGE